MNFPHCRRGSVLYRQLKKLFLVFDGAAGNLYKRGILNPVTTFNMNMFIREPSRIKTFKKLIVFCFHHNSLSIFIYYLKKIYIHYISRYNIIIMILMLRDHTLYEPIALLQFFLDNRVQRIFYFRSFETFILRHRTQNKLHLNIASMTPAYQLIFSYVYVFKKVVLYAMRRK